MEKCRLCSVNDATKKNSHLVTWALIKDSINRNGFTERDYDITYSISGLKSPTVHIGRSILPEHITEILGESVSENEMTNSKNPLSKDFILCPTCETGIGKIENSFINSVYKKLERTDFTTLEEDNKRNKFLSLSTFETKLTLILSYSIFFRTSIVNLNNYCLKNSVEERIRLILYDLIRFGQNDLEKYINDLHFDVLPYPLLMCYLESNKNSKTNKNIVVQHQSKIPYSIWAHKLIFQLFEKSTHIGASVEHFYGLSETINPKEYFPYKPASQMKICIIPDNKRNKMMLSALDFMANFHMNNMKSLFNEACKGLLHRKATEHEKNVFAHNYSILGTAKIDDKSRERFIQAFSQTFNIKY